VADYLERHVQPGDIIAGNLWYNPALSWYFDRGNDVTFSADDNPRILADIEDGHRTWYVLIGRGKGSVSNSLQSILNPIPGEEWEIPE
jgi:hypothetical protein